MNLSLTHVLISAIWAVAELSTVALFVVYHVSISIFADIALAVFVVPNAYYLTRLAMTPTAGLTETTSGVKSA